MIISHKHRFIFIKTNKTAGTSIEIALSGYCGENDVITGISPDDEITRKQLGFSGPGNNLLPFRKYSLKQWLKTLRKMRLRRIGPHSSAKLIIDIFGEKLWNNYYKFCFERNPWDRVVSLYFWYYRSRARPPISSFLDSDIPKRLKKFGIENYTINGNVVVDRICRYEMLEEELESVCNNYLGIPGKPVLPRAKGDYRVDRRHYREILNDSDRDRIAEMFADEIALLNYKF